LQAAHSVALPPGLKVPGPQGKHPAPLTTEPGSQLMAVQLLAPCQPSSTPPPLTL
jgi:hypothetical protein